MHAESHLNRYYLYVTGILDNPILRSQVQNWIEVLQGKGIVYDILSCPSIPYLVRHGGRQRAVVSEYRKRLQGEIHQAVTLRSLDRMDPFSPLIKTWRIRRLIASRIGRDEKAMAVLQSRASVNYDTFARLRRIDDRVRLVFDYRGASPEEYLNSLGYDSLGEVRDPGMIQAYNRFVQRDAAMLKAADLVFCVSQPLKDYLLGLPGCTEQAGKICVVPGAADENLFFPDPELGEEKRKHLGLEGKRILIYTGRLKNKYHKKDLVFEFALHFIAQNADHHFICLTPDTAMARELQNRHSLPADRIMIRFVHDPREINAFLNAADLGIILRDDIMTNRVSSPTKLAEYLLAGLPVMASDHIGDYSDFIRDNRLGCIVGHDVEEMLRAARGCGFSFAVRAKNSAIAAARFSKQANAEKIVAALATLAPPGEPMGEESPAGRTPEAAR